MCYIGRDMERVRFGRSGLWVSRVAFGGIPIMRLARTEAVRVVRGCIELGVTFIDTANAYLDSEEKIGAAIRGATRESLVLASKSGALDKKTFTAHLDNALTKLGTDYLDFYQHHNIATPGMKDAIFAPGGAFEGMMDAVKAGKVRFPAFSSHSVPLAIEIMRTNLFYAVQLPYNFIDTEAEKEAIPLARELDMGFIAMKPLGGGMLDNAPLAFRFLAAAEGVVPDPGIEKVEEMSEIAAVLETGAPLSANDWTLIERYRADLGPSWCHRCDYCQPCPQEIPISLALGAESSFKRFTLERVKNMVGGSVEKARGCVECRQCESRCPYHLRIPELLKKTVAWWDAHIPASR